jgi:nucleotide-binding universal stress UspA family protein
MADRDGLRVLVATDGSPAARAAMATAIDFPWPPGTRAAGVVARRVRAARGRPVYVVRAFERHFDAVAARARQALQARWPDAEVHVVDASPVDAILATARREHADAIVLGWRGHGPVRRLLMGSVSHGVVRHATGPVLVVPRRPARIARFVVGIDGSALARRAAALVARLRAPAGGRVTLVGVIEPLSVPSNALLPRSIRATLLRELAAMQAESQRRMQDELDRAARGLKDAGWSVRTVVRSGAPLAMLLETVRAEAADVLAVGARGTGGVERLLLGSVASGALNRCPVPVLVVR